MSKSVSTALAFSLDRLLVAAAAFGVVLAVNLFVNVTAPRHSESAAVVVVAITGGYE